MAEAYWERKLWEPDIETMPRKELRELQRKKLFPQLIYAYENAPLYHELYDREKVDVYKIRTIEDFQKYVPTVVKDDVRKYRERTGDIFGGSCCLPLTARNFGSEHIYDGKVCHSTGTTGEPTYYIYTKDDVMVQGNNDARDWWRCGVRPGDFILAGYGGQNVMEWHLSLTGHETGFRMIKAIRHIYNGLDPTNDFALARQFEAQGIHVRWIYTTIPGFRWFVQRIEREGKNLKRDYFPELKSVWQTGELSKGLMDYASELFGVPTTTGSAINDGCWRAGSCIYEWKEGDGSRMYAHWPEDTHFVEVFPPGSDKPVEGVEFGEPAFTPLDYKAMAYIRFRGEDWYRIKWDPCPYCGYTHMQARIMSKVSESVEVKGKVITMGDVEDILYSYPELRVLPAQLVREEPQPQDKLRLRISYDKEKVKEPEQFSLKLADDFKNKLGVDTQISMILPEEVRAIFHKFERVIKVKGGE